MEDEDEEPSEDEAGEGEEDDESEDEPPEDEPPDLQNPNDPRSSRTFMLPSLFLDRPATVWIDYPKFTGIVRKPLTLDTTGTAAARALMRAPAPVADADRGRRDDLRARRKEPDAAAAVQGAQRASQKWAPLHGRCRGGWQAACAGARPHARTPR